MVIGHPDFQSTQLFKVILCLKLLLLPLAIAFVSI
jgi:hypothetical protein